MNPLNARPLHDRLMVRRLDEGEQKSGGIINPDTAKEKPQRGTVVAAGEGRVKQIVYGDSSRQGILRGVNSLANAVKVTLGPKGRHVILDNPHQHEAA